MIILKIRYTFIYFKDPEGRKKCSVERERERERERGGWGLEAAMEGRDAVARESLQATVRFASTKGMDLFFVMRLVCRVFFSENRFLVAADFLFL
jgi:hypothetical protein